MPALLRRLYGHLHLTVNDAKSAVASVFGRTFLGYAFRAGSGRAAWSNGGSPDLNLSNRPVPTRRPGGVAGARSMTIASYAD